MLYNNWEIGHPRVANQEIAFKLNTNPSTVSITLNKLKSMTYNQSPIIIYEKYHGVQLTKHGLKIASLIERKFRIFETFLYCLGHDLCTMDDIINQSEIDYRFTESIFHNIPEECSDIDFSYCPHGSRIPDEFDYNQRRSRLFSISSNGYFATDRDYQFVKYDEFIFNSCSEITGKREILDKINKLDLRYKDTITIIKHNETSIDVSIDNNQMNIPIDLAKMIYLAS